MGPAAGAPEAREPPGVPGPACVRCLSSPCLLSREASFSQLERAVQRCYDAPRDTQLKDARPSSKPTTLVILELLGTETTKGEFIPPFSAIRRFKTNKQTETKPPQTIYLHAWKQVHPESWYGVRKHGGLAERLTEVQWRLPDFVTEKGSRSQRNSTHSIKPTL